MEHLVKFDLSFLRPILSNISVEIGNGMRTVTVVFRNKKFGTR